MAGGYVTRRWHWQFARQPPSAGNSCPQTPAVPSGASADPKWSYSSCCRPGICPNPQQSGWRSPRWRGAACSADARLFVVRATRIQKVGVLRVTPESRRPVYWYCCFVRSRCSDDRHLPRYFRKCSTEFKERDCLHALTRASLGLESGQQEFWWRPGCQEPEF